MGHDQWKQVRAGLLVAWLLVAVLPRGSAQFLTAEHPVSATEVRFGLSCAQTGRVGHIGLSLKDGYLAGFAQWNREGGVHGRKLVLVDYDDHYGALAAVANTERLINDDKVFALVGYLGTATTEGVMAMAESARLPMFAPISGALRLREPPPRNVFLLRASYLDECRALVGHLREDAGVQKIALFRRRDEDGDAVRDALKTALNERSLPLVAEGDYVRNSNEVQEAFTRIAAAGPEAIVLTGTYAPCVHFVDCLRKARLRPAPRLCCTSRVGLEELQRALGAAAEGIVSSEVVPCPTQMDLPLVRDYQRELAATGSRRLDHVSLEGYISARVLGEVLANAGQDLSSASFADALLGHAYPCNPFRFGYDANGHQINGAVFLAQVRGGVVRPLERLNPEAR